MKVFFKITSILLFVSCSTRSIVPKNSYTFNYVDKSTGDTAKFHAYKNLDTAIFYAKKERKNILLIFSGWAMASVHGIEWRTLAQFEDHTKIQENFILAWLAVDDKRLAKDTTRIVFWYGQQRQLKSIGDQHKYFEEQVFNQSTQPLLCFVDSAKKPFGKIMGYNPDKKIVEEFIKSGLKE